MNAKMKNSSHTFPRILVILHVFYSDQIPWFLEKLSHIHLCDWDLVVTYPKGKEIDKTAFRELNGSVRFIPVENVGYDVWPFIYALQQVQPAHYDWVLKLHTKGPTEKGDYFRFNGRTFREYDWRDELVNAFLLDDARWERILKQFSRKDIGMVCAWRLMIFSDLWPEDGPLLEQELQRLGLHTNKRRFCAGTILALRVPLIEPVLKRNLHEEDFPAKNESHSGGTLAHVYERVFSLLAPAQGFRVYLSGNRIAYHKRRLKEAFEHLSKWIFDINRDSKYEERKYLRIMGFRFYVGRKN